MCNTNIPELLAWWLLCVFCVHWVLMTALYTTPMSADKMNLSLWGSRRRLLLYVYLLQSDLRAGCRSQHTYEFPLGVLYVTRKAKLCRTMKRPVWRRNLRVTHPLSIHLLLSILLEAILYRLALSSRFVLLSLRPTLFIFCFSDSFLLLSQDQFVIITECKNLSLCLVWFPLGRWPLWWSCVN